MKMKKNIYCLVVFLFFTFCAIAQKGVIDEVIWVVGDEAILRSDVEKQILQMKYERVDIEGDPYCVVPEQMAVRKLFMHQAKLDSVEANESTITMQVEGRISELISQIGSQQKLEEYFGKPLRELKEDLRVQAREQMIIQQVQQNIVGEQKITPSDVNKFFSQNKETIDMPIVPTKIEVQIIEVEPPYSQKEIEEIKEKLRGFKSRVESGEVSFSMLATLYSDDMGSARMGGELGFMGKGQLVSAFANELFSMSEPGKISRVVESEFGFHIIQFLERRGDKANCRHILLKPKVSLEAQKKAKQLMDSVAMVIRNEKLTFESAVSLYSQDKDTRNNAGLMFNMQDNSSRFEFQNLPPDLAKVASTMKVGEISDPFFMENSKGKQCCAIIKIKARHEQHTANLEDDFQMLKAYVQSDQNAKAIKNWVEQKQAETFVRISPEFQNCDFQYPGWNKTEEK